MADVSIPRDAVEAGARAMMRSAYAGDDSQWDKLQPSQQAIVRERAVEVLNAAAPLIVAAELERLIAVAVEYGKNCPCPGADEPGVNCTNRFHFEAARVIKRVRIRLNELRAQS